MFFLSSPGVDVFPDTSTRWCDSIDIRSRVTSRSRFYWIAIGCAIGVDIIEMGTVREGAPRRVVANGGRVIATILSCWLRGSHRFNGNAIG